MNVEQLINTVLIGYKSRRPVLALSSPGIGKSSAVYQAASRLSEEYGESFGVICIRAATSNPAELADIKYVVDGVVRDAVQDWVPTQAKVEVGLVPKRGLIFLDEMADNTAMVQSALQALLLDRRLGSAVLADGWGTVGASNRQTDKAAAGRLSTAVINRCLAVTVEPDTDVFLSFAMKNNLHFAVQAYCRWKPNCWNFDPQAKRANPAFCSPRSMHILSDFLYVDERPMDEVVTGIIGDETGTEVCGFLEILSELPDLNAIINDPVKHPIPKRLDVAIAAIYALIDRARRNNSLLPAVLSYVSRLDQSVELATAAIKDLLRVDTKVAIHPAVQRWISDPKNVRILSGVDY